MNNDKKTKRPKLSKRKRTTRTLASQKCQGAPAEEVTEKFEAGHEATLRRLSTHFVANCAFQTFAHLVRTNDHLINAMWNDGACRERFAHEMHSFIPSGEALTTSRTDPVLRRSIEISLQELQRESNEKHRLLNAWRRMMTLATEFKRFPIYLSNATYHSGSERIGVTVSKVHKNFVVFSTEDTQFRVSHSTVGFQQRLFEKPFRWSKSNRNHLRVTLSQHTSTLVNRKFRLYQSNLLTLHPDLFETLEQCILLPSSLLALVCTFLV